MLENYKFKYRSRGKWIYVPNERCERRAVRILDYFEKISFPEYFYHYRRGGHVLALHEHLKNDFFFKIDIKNFFYSIARNRVSRAFSAWGLKGAPTYAKWSCVATPYDTGPRYVVPIGFRQSPLVASLVLLQSPVADAIDRAQKKGVTISVYLDDFIGSHAQSEVLTAAYEDVLEACLEAKLAPNLDKLVAPCEAIVAFNCSLTKGVAHVMDGRIEQFYRDFPGLTARQSFEAYVASVSKMNANE